MNHLTENATFEDAARYGPDGRILWALANLGRTPLIQRVWQKANERLKPERRDKPKEFGAACERLRAQGLLRLVGTERMELVFNSARATMQVRCVVSGCAVTAPAGFSKEDAIRQAELSGFVIRGAQAFCGAHAPAEVTAEPCQETRRSRRNRERQERKTRRTLGASESPQEPSGRVSA
jgi:hypothetical protein